MKNSLDQRNNFSKLHPHIGGLFETKVLLPIDVFQVSKNDNVDETGKGESFLRSFWMSQRGWRKLHFGPRLSDMPQTKMLIYAGKCV